VHRWRYDAMLSCAGQTPKTVTLNARQLDACHRWTIARVAGRWQRQNAG
jgi:predicted secreted protein